MYHRVNQRMRDIVLWLHESRWECGDCYFGSYDKGCCNSILIAERFIAFLVFEGYMPFCLWFAINADITIQRL